MEEKIILLAANSKGYGLGILKKIFDDFAEVFPNFLGAIGVFFFGWLIAKSIYKIALTVFRKIGVDKLKDKLEEIEFISKMNYQFYPSVVLAKLIYYVLMLMILLVSAGILNIKEISELLLDIIRLVPNLLTGVLVLIIGLLIAEALKNIVVSTSKSLNIPGAKILGSFVFFFVFLNGLMIALKKATIPTEFLTNNLSIILAGIVIAFAIGYGLASKNMVANFLANFYSKDKFNIGDKISICGYIGTILDIDKAAMTLDCGDKKVVIPLYKLSEETVEKLD